MAPRFGVIVGGRASAPSSRDVMAECQRRKAAAGIEASRARAMAAGGSMPRELRYLGMQMDFTASALASLDPIPADFASDIYWPSAGLDAAVSTA